MLLRFSSLASSLKTAALLIGIPMFALASQVMYAGGTRPAVSPDGRLVAFSSTRDGTWDVYVVATDGTRERRVTKFAEKNFTSLGPATWVGDRILVTDRAHDTTHVALLDVMGRGSASEVVSVPADARQIRPSADGRRLVLVHGDPRHPRVAISNIDGTGLRDILDGDRGVLQPALSRDGKEVAISLVDSTMAGELVIVGADRGDRRVIARFDSSEGMPIWADWSPDGKRIAFQIGKYNPKKIEESTAHLWVVDVASGKTTKLAPHTATYLDETPAWFPDGSRIAFQSNRSGILQVWTMKPDGTDARQLTSWEAPKSAP